MTSTYMCIIKRMPKVQNTYERTEYRETHNAQWFYHVGKFGTVCRVQTLFSIALSFFGLSVSNRLCLFRGPSKILPGFSPVRLQSFLEETTVNEIHDHQLLSLLLVVASVMEKTQL